MNFQDAESVKSVVYDMKQIDEQTHCFNRAKMLRLYNGFPSFTEAEAKAEGVEFNYNTLSGTILISNAKRTWNNAFTKTANYFKVRLNSGIVHKRGDWSNIITSEISRLLKKNRKFARVFSAVQKQTGCQAFMWGPAPVWWKDRTTPWPTTLAIEDLLIPSQTTTDFENLTRFAIFQAFTYPQLAEKLNGKENAGWNKDFIRFLLAHMPQSSQRLTAETNPLKVEEMMRENGGYWEGDAAPIIRTWTFYYRKEDSDEEEWRKCVILDDNETTGDFHNDFLFENERSYGDHVNELIHVVYADGNNKAPYLFHATRSLGFLTFKICHVDNRLNCRFDQHVFEQMNALLRVEGADDRDRPQMINLWNQSILENGVSFVPASERHQINDGLVMAAFGRHRQMMSEASSSFIQNVETDSDRETATLTMAKVQQVNALVSSMLNDAYDDMNYRYAEMCRRLTLKDNPRPEVKEFRRRCLSQGVPVEMMDVDKWDIDAERVLGGGNPMLGVQEARALMEVRSLHDPDAQRRILHKYDLAITNDAAEAELLAPVAQKTVSDSVTYAEQSVGTLMTGVPLTFKEGVNHSEIAEVWLRDLAMLVQQCKQMGGMATAQQIIGFRNIAFHIAQQIEKLSEDKGEQQRVKVYGDQLGKIMNDVRAFAQRLMQQQQSGNGQLDPETISKIKADQITATAKAQNSRESHAQKTQQKQVSWVLDQKRKQQQHELDMRKELNQVAVDNIATDLKTAAEIKREHAKAKSETAIE